MPVSRHIFAHKLQQRAPTASADPLWLDEQELEHRAHVIDHRPRAETDDGTVFVEPEAVRQER